MQIGPPLVLSLFLSLKGANPDRIDDRGVGWLCGYKGPLQDSWQRGLLSGWKFQPMTEKYGKMHEFLPKTNKNNIE